MLTIESATNPQYVNSEGTAIDLLVKFAEFQEAIGFTAAQFDTASYGIELFNRAKAGEYGEVASYVPPPEPKPKVQPETTGLQTI